MNLLALRTEVLNHGFDPTVMSSRINAYINDAQNHIARRVDYYQSEASQAIVTTANVSTIAFPADFAKHRSMLDTDRQQELTYVTLRDIDRSPTSTGTPNFYAVDGANIHLYPTPDSSSHNLLLRYWKMPTQLVQDTDVPSLPVDYHRLLWLWAVMECYAAEDDTQQQAPYWKQRFDELLAEFEADQRFPSDDAPTQIRDMWSASPPLVSGAWQPWT